MCCLPEVARGGGQGHLKRIYSKERLEYGMGTSIRASEDLLVHHKFEQMREIDIERENSRQYPETTREVQKSCRPLLKEAYKKAPVLVARLRTEA